MFAWFNKIGSEKYLKYAVKISVAYRLVMAFIYFLF